MFADQRRRARKQLGIHRGQCGSVTFIQRFGSALNLTPHFHTLVLDGVYTGTSSEPGPFSPLPPPETEDVARVLAGTARRILRRLERSGVETDEDAIKAEARTHIAPYKLPKLFVYVDRITRSPSGKADYRWAREAAHSAIAGA